MENRTDFRLGTQSRAARPSGSLERQEFGPEIRFWKERLRGAPAALDLPTSRKRPQVQSFRGAAVSFALPIELSSEIGLLGRREGATVFMVLLATFKILLARYSGQMDILVGSWMSGKPPSQLRNEVDHFTGLRILRTDLSGDPTFLQLLDRLKQSALAALANRDLPFEDILKELAIVPDLSRHPLFQVVFELQNLPHDKTTSLNSESSSATNEHLRIEFDLKLRIFETRAGFRGSLLYATDLFDRDNMDRLLGHFEKLLWGIVAAPRCRISEIPILTEAEQDQQLVGWTDTAAAYPSERCLHELIAEQAERTPNAVAVIFEDRQLTYADLERRANQLAHHLVALGIGPDVVVGLLAERSIEMVVGLLGILKAGGAYLPLDPGYPKERLSFMLDDSGAKVLLTQAGTGQNGKAFEFVSGISAELPVLDMAAASAAWTDQPTTDPDWGGLGLTSRNLAYVIYTSGSTGKPKGVMVEHRSVVNYMTWMQSAFPLRPENAVVHKTPFTFDASVWEFYAPLLSGSKLVIASPEGHQNTVYLSNLLQQKAIHTLQVVPSLLGMLLDTPEFSACVTLRRVFCGGETLPLSFVERFHELLPNAQLINLYGPTEATVYSSYFVCPNSLEENRCSIGRPIANTQIYILDEQRQLVPIGVAGELHIAGDGVARGYRNRLQLTADRFVKDPFKRDAGARMYKTGDRARWLANQTIDFLGRSDSQVKIRGFRIEPSEIEFALKGHPAVRSSVVMVRNEEPAGERLVAYVAGEPSRLRESVLDDFLKTRLPNYMLPSAIVVLEKFPLNSSGKIDRQALPKPVAKRNENKYVGARDTLEAELITIWENALGIQLIGVTDDFFQIGGRSIEAVRIFKEIEEKLGKILPLTTLFQMPTVEKLATALRQRGWIPSWSPMVAIQPYGSRPPFFSVHGGFGGILFYSHLSRCLGPEQPLYGLQAQGLDGGPIVHASIETMASSYIDEVRKIQRHGPYFLGGYSFGGFVVFEMARQLLAAGEPVALVVLFDTDRREIPPSWARRFYLKFKNLKAGELLDTFQRGSAKIGRILTKGKVTLLKRVGHTDRPEEATQPRGLEVVQSINQRALATYKMRTYPGRITLFRTEGVEAGGKSNGADYDWTSFAEEGIEIHVVPGEHETIFAHPNVRTLAKKLDLCIQIGIAEFSKKNALATPPVYLTSSDPQPSATATP